MRNLEGYAETSRNVQQKDSRKVRGKFSGRCFRCPFSVPWYAGYCRKRCKNSSDIKQKPPAPFQNIQNECLGASGAPGPTYVKTLKTHFKLVQTAPQIDKHDTKSITNMFSDRLRGPNQAQPTQPSLRRVAGCEKTFVCSVFWSKMIAQKD